MYLVQQLIFQHLKVSAALFITLNRQILVCKLVLFVARINKLTNGARNWRIFIKVDGNLLWVYFWTNDERKLWKITYIF
jgi:hypothetical protein